MKRFCLTLLVASAIAAIGVPAQAALITFDAFLSGLAEVPANASPATGFGQVVLNNVANTITVDLNWNGLVAPATAAHIHGPAAPGVNAGVLFPLAGVAAATSGAITTQTFAITAGQITQLQGGLFYMNLHSTAFPGGEIRGQLIAETPEPATLGMLGLGLAGLIGIRRSVTARR